MRHFWQEEMAFYIHFLIGDLETPNGRAAVHDALKSHSVSAARVGVQSVFFRLPALRGAVRVFN